MNIFRTESYRSGITLSIGFSLLAKIFALSSSLALAAFFGTSAGMDVYLYALFTATLVTTVLSSLNAAVIIPESMRLAEQEGEERSREFVNFFLYAYAAVGSALFLVLLPAPVRVFGAVSRFNGTALAGNTGLLYASLPLFPLMLVSNFLVEVFASRKYFTVPMMASMGSNACVLASVVLLHGRLGVMSALAGLSAAYAAQVAALLFVMRRSMAWRFGVPRSLPSRNVFSDALFSYAGNLASAVSAYVPMYLLSGFDRGTISAMNYGRQAAELPNNFITQQFSSVAAIKLNEVFARRSREESDRVMVSSLRGLSFVLVPLSLFGAFYATDLVSVLYGRGAFGERSVAAAAAFFRLFALLLPLYAVNTLSARIFMAARKVREAVWFQLAMNLLLAGIVWTAVRGHGALGYPAGLIVFYSLNVVVAGLYLSRLFPWIRYWSGVAYLLKVVAMDLALLLPVWYLDARFGPSGGVWRALAAFAVYFPLLGWLSMKLGVNEDFGRAAGGILEKFSALRRPGR